MRWFLLTQLVFQVTQLASYFEPLIVASVGLASKLHDHQQQMTILDQSKTLAESALQMLYAAKEGGGNPKVLIIQGAFTASSDVCFLASVCEVFYFLLRCSLLLI